MKKRLKKIIDGGLRFIGPYKYYALSILSAVILFYYTEGYVSTIEADFEAPVENIAENENTVGNRTMYSYFLDLSPSMQGFLYEDINTDMTRVANAFEQINAGNENNRFYWCKDNVELVESASDFYDSMRSDGILNRYYGQILRNVTATDNNGEEIEENEELNDLEQAIDNIDLSRIFASNYQDTLDENISSLNVIVTDLNFFRDTNDFERHDQYIDSFAQRLQTAAANANISFYMVSGDYAGTAQDAYDGNRGNTTSASFYVIVYSEDESKYIEYCNRFENLILSSRVQKFELCNRINRGNSELVGNLSAFRALNLDITKENLNYADGVFQSLDGNEFALQLVTEGTNIATFAAPIAEVNFSGYSSADAMGLDDSKIGVEIDLYQNQIRSPWQDSYEVYDDTSVILEKSAGMYYAVNKWFLRVNLTFNTHPDISEPDFWLSKLLTGMRRDYIVINMKFYMERPSFSVPEWVAEAGYPHVNGDEEVHGIRTVIDSVMQYKEEVYAMKPLSDRYLGNKVIYLLY